MTDEQQYLMNWSLTILKIASLFFLFFISLPVALGNQDPVDSLINTIEIEQLNNAEILTEFESDNTDLERSRLERETKISVHFPHNILPSDVRYRLRFQPDKEDAAASAYNRLDLSYSNLKVGLLLHRDSGETSFYDLWRIYFTGRSQRTKVILGDFQVNQGLGWCIASTPSWLSIYRMDSSWRSYRTGIIPNRSSEEGRGWKGAAIQSNWGNYAFSLWGGYAAYDARWDSDSLNVIPYSTQGDHTGGRLSRIVQVDEYHTGSRLYYQGEKQIELGLSGWMSRFSRPISPNTEAMRFEGLDRPIQTIGADLRIPLKPTLTLSTEVSVQDRHAWGGAVMGVNSVHTLHFSWMAYRATSAFRLLHARPYLPFGENAKGETGGCVGFESRVNRIRFGVWWAEAVEEEVDASGYSKRSSGGRCYLIIPFPRMNTVECNYSLRHYYEKDHEETHRLRFHAFHDRDSWRLDYRQEHVFSDDGYGTLYTLCHRERLMNQFEITGAITYFFQKGKNAAPVIVEQTAPGLFPARLIWHDGVRFSGFFKWAFIQSTDGWLQVGITRYISDGDNIESGNLTDLLFRIGMELHYTHEDDFAK